MHQSNRIIGCILGGAIGDCFGGPYEGRSTPFSIDEARPWQLSDDTQLTLATAEAIAEHGKVDPALIAKHFANWFRNSRISGAGAATHKALTELSAGHHWALVGMKGEMAAGNGAAMRIAPLAFCLDPKNQKARVAVRDVCRITHHSDEAYAGGLAVLLAVRAAWEGIWDGHGDLMGAVLGFLPDTRLRDRLTEISLIEESVSLEVIAARFGSSGYVVESVPLALCAAQRVGLLGFETMIRELVMVGGDTDTIASIAGQISGTAMGSSGLPAQMIMKLPELDSITEIAERFSKTMLHMVR